MYSNFSKHVKTKSYFSTEDRILIAVSGGIDSMLLCKLMIDLGHAFGVAHVDHNTRNGESHKDADFVRQYCLENNLDFHLKSIEFRNSDGNFHNYAHKERYAYFDNLGYDKILTAHHKDDLTETILINVLNGRSTASLPEVNGKYVRPLLPFTKSEILEEAHRLGVSYVTDKSNDESYYLRNYLRNEVLNNLSKVVPDYDIKVINLSARIDEDAQLLNELAMNLLPLIRQDEKYLLSLTSIKEQSPLLLFHLLKQFGTNRDQAKNIVKSAHKVGATFYSNSHVLLVDRKDLIISKLESANLHSKTIRLLNLPKVVAFGKYNIYFEIAHKTGPFSQNCNFFPIEKIGQSIELRSWQHGDIFKPFGMSGKTKSVKKTFIDNKIDGLSKSEIPLLIDQESGSIMWILGIRSSEEFKCENHHDQFLKVEF